MKNPQALTLWAVFAGSSIAFAGTWAAATDSSASNSTYLEAGESGTTTDTASPLTYSFDVSEPGNRHLWIRYRTTGSSEGALYAALNGGSFTLLPIPSTSGWLWSVLLTDNLTAGTNEFSIARNTDNVEIDRFYVSSDEVTIPLGKGGDVLEFTAQTLAEWADDISWGTNDSSPEGDSDGDGRNNRMEYRMGSDPLVADGKGLMFELAPDESFEFQLPVSKTATSRQARVEMSTDLSSWAPVSDAVTRMVSEDSKAEWVTIILPAASEAYTQRFFRVVYD